MNNIHAEVDEILRTRNKKAIVSLFLSMHGNYLRATEAEAKLANVRAEIERKDKLIEQMLDALEAVAPFLHWLDQEQGIHLAGDMLHGNILAVIKAAKGEV